VSCPTPGDRSGSTQTDECAKSEQGNRAGVPAPISVFVSAPIRPAAKPTDAEIGLVMAAKYESELLIHGVVPRKRLDTVRVLIGVAVLIFAYDAVSLIIVR